MNWQREIPTALAVCIAWAIFLFMLAAGIWWVTR